MKASVGVINLQSMLCWWVVCFNHGTEHTLQTYMLYYLGCGCDLLRSWDKSSTSLPVFLWVARALPGLALSWSDVSTGVSREEAESETGLRPQCFASVAHRHTHIRIHIPPYSPAHLPVCVSFYATLVLKSAGSILCLVFGEYEWIHQWYKPCLHIFAPCYSLRPVFLSAQFSFLFFFIMKWVMLNIIFFSMNVLWVCLLTKDSTERPQKQAVEICDSRHCH